MKRQILVVVTVFALGGTSSCQQPAAEGAHAAVAATPATAPATDLATPDADPTTGDDPAPEVQAKHHHYHTVLTHKRLRHRTTVTR